MRAGESSSFLVVLLKVALWKGAMWLMLGYRYLALITACASTGVPCPLPVFDLSQRLFVDNVKGQKSEHDGAITSNAGHSA